jgi:hypothetical protein
MADPSTVYGIPVPQILAFALTIGASYLSARWGSAEIRKQFRKKTQDDERAAAAELIPLLMKFAADCEKKIAELSAFMNSGGQKGKDDSIYGVKFEPAIQLAASRLGPRVTERAIKLALTQSHAELWVSQAWAIEKNERDSVILSFLALLSLRARFLVDMAAEKAGLSMRHSEDEIERLRKEAFKFAHEIDSADEKSWH